MSNTWNIYNLKMLVSFYEFDEENNSLLPTPPLYPLLFMYSLMFLGIRMEARDCFL